MGTGFAKRKKQAKLLQEKFSQLQEEMKHKEFTGSAGNGLVTVLLSGEYEMKKININKECVDPDDIEGLQDLIKAAYNDASKQIDAQAGTPDSLGSMMSMPF